MSGPRRPCVPASAVSDGNEVAGCGDEAGGRTAGRLGAGVVARYVHDDGRLPEVGAWRSKLAEAVLGQLRVDLQVDR